MVCTRNDLSAWKDFPKGLRVLLLNEDNDSAAEIKSKLEAMDYIVYTFCNENEALSAVSSRPESFHVAIVEVSTSSNNWGLKFLGTAKDLPTIMTSNIQCISTMMKCIALGAVEFLRKPLSEDKLRNIWQHVVHKAFSVGDNDLSESLKPVKDSVASMLHLQSEGEPKHEHSDKIENASAIHENDCELSAVNNKYPAPPTPQLEQGGRLLVNEDGQEHTNGSTEKESGEPDGESKSVETTSGNTVAEVNAPTEQPEGPSETMVKEEADLVDGTKGEGTVDSHPQDRVNSKDSHAGAKRPDTGLHSSCPNKANKKKLKVDWTTELHKKFVQAVDQLGIDQAIPSRILELMKVEGLTRHNVASHLQKYRMHKRDILPKEVDQRWTRRDQTQGSCHPHKPIMAFPPCQSNHVVPVGPFYPMWGTPHPASIQSWGSQGYYWQPTETWHWKPYPGVHADAWGCPVMSAPPGNCSEHSKYAECAWIHCSSILDNNGMPQSSVDHQPAEEVIEEVVKEAINKPWLPLPLGLKSPSTESVIAELSRQGISTVPLSSDQRL
ncbi:tobamovirus multiplication protein 2A-like isoform X1 [Hibiscus syriacus]|uniref:Tobamovirus multiplication protein 2A-like isoform X1 n=1 Tax=Hibiscus syriacus TaxID=106335 RepID=A0A6A2YJF5_HIBSY|nr:tobamovirus multiplication protein 2A-like isoform X1 [Hibiscus syriacus]